MIAIIVSGKRQQVDVSSDTPLLWVLRENLGMTGTKFGCGIALCGACTVHLDGKPVRSCITPVGRRRKKVTTIEGLSADANHPVQRPGSRDRRPQCGYCQSGQIMSARRCWPRSRSPPTPTSTRRWRGTSAAAAPISAFARRSIARGHDRREVRNEQDINLSRRGFLKAGIAGGGLVLGLYLPA